MDASDEPRTEQATPRKLARARRAGQIARSSDLVAASALLALAGALVWVGPRLLAALQQLVLRGLRAAAEPEPFSVGAFSESVQQLGWLTACPLLAIAFAAWLSGFLQVGPLVAGAAIAPDLQRVDPGMRLRALLSPERLVDLCWTGFRLCVLLGVAASSLERSARGLLSLARGAVPRALSVLLLAAEDLILRVGIAAVVLGAADFVYRRARHSRELRMGRREVALEQRESYGLPEQPERRRRLRLEASAHAALRALEDATVLLVDGRGRAVALAFDSQDSAQRAPRVVAKAEAKVAQRLQARAEQAAIPVRLHAVLVAVLFRLELTEEVPRACYDAVAEVFRALDDKAP